MAEPGWIRNAPPTNGDAGPATYPAVNTALPQQTMGQAQPQGMLIQQPAGQMPMTMQQQPQQTQQQFNSAVAHPGAAASLGYAGGVGGAGAGAGAAGAGGGGMAQGGVAQAQTQGEGVQAQVPIAGSQAGFGGPAAQPQGGGPHVFARPAPVGNGQPIDNGGPATGPTEGHGGAAAAAAATQQAQQQRRPPQPHPMQQKSRDPPVHNVQIVGPKKIAGPRSKKKRYFTKELQRLMYGYGDSKNPAEESVNVAEELVCDYVAGIAAAADRNSKLHNRTAGGKFRLEDILVSLRKYPKKYARVKDLLHKDEDIKNARKTMDEKKFEKDK